MDSLEKKVRPLRAPEKGGGSSDEKHKWEEGTAEDIARWKAEQRWKEFKRADKFNARIDAADPQEQKRLALEAIKDGDGRMVASQPWHFKARDKELLLAVIQNSGGELNSKWIEKIVIDDDIAQAIVDSDPYNNHGQLQYLAHLISLAQCENLGDRVAHILAEEGWQTTVIGHLLQFENLSKDTFLLLWEEIKRAIEIHEKQSRPKTSPIGYRDRILSHLYCFQGLDKEVLEVIFRDGGGPEFMVSSIGFFEGVTHDEFAEMLMKWHQWGKLAASIDKLHVSDKAAILQKFIDHRVEGHIVEHIDKWKDVVTIEQATAWFKKEFEEFTQNEHALADEGSDEEYYDEDYGITTSDSEISAEHARMFLQQSCKINDAYGNKIDPVLGRLMKDYETWPGFEAYYAYQELMMGRIVPSLSKIGVTHGGEAGFHQLAEGLRSVRGKIIREQCDLRLIAHNPFVRHAAMDLVRYSNTDFGRGSEQQFKYQAYAYIDIEKTVPKMDPSYAPSPILDIAKVDRTREAKFKHTEDFLSRYRQILISLIDAKRELYRGARGLHDLRLTIEFHAQMLIGDLQTKLQDQTNPHARQNLEQRISWLQEITGRTAPLQEQFNILRKFRGEFDTELRQLMFFLGFRYNSSYLEESIESFSRTNPTLNDITWVMNFVDHIVNQETLSKYFTDKKAAKSFRDLIDLDAIEQGLARMRNASSKSGSMSIQFLPNRGLLAEFSGQIADACWARTDELTILEEFPNITALLMVQNPETIHERLAGASLLIETMSDKNEPLLVIRGLNPIQNVINQLDVEDFYQKLIEYLKPIASQQGRKLAIVIDDHSGGASTNRPVLFAYLNDLQRKLPRVRLRSSTDTTFNGYVIVNDCYLVQ